jgi:hypothetical protein
MLRMFARPEAYPFCYRCNADADGAMLFSAYAGGAFAARPIVVTSVGCMADVKIIVKPSENIGRPKKAKRTTARLKTVVATV